MAKVMTEKGVALEIERLAKYFFDYAKDLGHDRTQESCYKDANMLVWTKIHIGEILVEGKGDDEPT